MQQKRRKLLVAMVAAFTLTGALPLLAQRGPGGNANRLDYLAGYLGLTESQKSQAQTIFDAAKTASETAQGQMTAAREALQAAVKANSSEAEIDRLAATLGVVQGQLAGIQAKASAKFYALLTAEQKAKYDQLQDRQGGPGGGGPRGFRKR